MLVLLSFSNATWFFFFFFFFCVSIHFVSSYICIYLFIVCPSHLALFSLRLCHFAYLPLPLSLCFEYLFVCLSNYLPICVPPVNLSFSLYVPLLSSNRFFNHTLFIYQEIETCSPAYFHNIIIIMYIVKLATMFEPGCQEI